MSILSFNQVGLKLAENVILDHANWQIQPGDRIALIGRNGAGKSTLLKLLQGDITPDQGQIQKKNGLTIAGLTQDVPASDNETVYHFLVKGLGRLGEVLAEFHRLSQTNHLDKMASCQQQMDHLQAWDYIPRIEAMATKLDLNPQALMNRLSGGQRRRVLLASALITEPDLLLLDEPTNHLDINTIEWLESYLKNYRGSVVVVTHDRQFLSQVANQILEIDRGQLYFYDCDYDTYLNRREAFRLSEQKQFDLFDKRLKEEEAWLRTGVKARRTRNEGRVRRLKAMREEYRQRRNQLGKIKTMNVEAAHSGKVVLEVEHLHYSIHQKELIRDFSFLLTRGDKVGIIGPNGCGKTTLIRLLLGELQPDSGKIIRGTSVEVAYFDQLRHQLDENKTVMANVADGADYVEINGHKKHVASYLKEFLFSSERFNQPVFSLSGGERNRLLLAKLLAKPVNLLVMDEPTNDLDIETLELLESMLMEYPGTLLLISHDREFINHVVSSVLVFEGNGKVVEFIGGYDDYHAYQMEKSEAAIEAKKSIKPIISDKKTTLNDSEQRELKKLPKQIELIEERISNLHKDMADLSFYQQNPDIIAKVNLDLKMLEESLSELYERWEALELKKRG